MTPRSLARLASLGVASLVVPLAIGACSKASAGTFPDLDPKSAKEETWAMDELGSTQVLVFASAKVALGKSCLKGAALDCEALKVLKAGNVVEVKKAQLDGRMSAGSRVCLALKADLVNGKGPSGSEDGFCKMKDGSLVSCGALESYAIKIVP